MPQRIRPPRRRHLQARPAGDQLVTVYCETGGFNLDYFRLG